MSMSADLCSKKLNVDRDSSLYFLSSGQLPRESELKLALKREVLLVQGSRSEKHDDLEWENVCASSDSETHVVGIKCSILKRHNHSASSKLEEDCKQGSMRLLNSFCIRNGFPLLPQDSSEFGRQHAGGDAPVGGRSGGAGEKRKSRANQNPVESRKSKSLKSGGGTFGGGGGGKRLPPNPSSSSAPESAGSDTASETSSVHPSITSASEDPVLPSAKKKKRRKTEASNATSPNSFSEADPSTRHKDKRKNMEKLQRSGQTRPPKASILVSSLNDIARIVKTERDNDWLDWTGSEDENIDEDERQTEQGPEKPIQRDLQAFMDSTKVLDRLNSIMGLNPYKKVIQPNKCVQIKWEPGSGEYIGVCINASVFLLTTLSVFSSLLIILGYRDPQPTTR